MKSYSEVADIVSKVHQIEEIMELLQKALEDIISVKIKCELWIEDKENLSYTEVAQFLICETSKVLHKNVSIAGIKIEKLASEQNDKEEDQSVKFEILTSLSQENQTLMEKYGTLSSDVGLQSKEMRKVRQKFKEQSRKYKGLVENFEKTQDAVQDVDERFTGFKEEFMNELHFASGFMSELQTQCQTLSAELKEIQDTQNKSREALSVQIVELKENFTETTANLLQKLDGFEAEQEHLKSILSEKKLSEVDLEYFCERNGQFDVECVEQSVLIIGHHEQQISENGDADLLTHLTECKKNPDHTIFIPVDKFNIEHLPEGHQNKDMHELIKAVADLTVRISVTMTSQFRPEFWPNTDISYPLYDSRGSTHLRAGSGMISNVMKGTTVKCPCDDCKNLDKPNQDWWNIVVRTAGSLVFDDIEASHTTIRLFYDTEDSPEVVLKHLDTSYFEILFTDRYLFRFVTCNKKLVDKLEKMLKHFDGLYNKINEAYMFNRDLEKFMFLVSHPHGCSKRISIGQWKKKYTEELLSIFTYFTCTCPGSSGASVYCMGFGSYIHEGSLLSGLNYSYENNLIDCEIMII